MAGKKGTQRQRVWRRFRWALMICVLLTGFGGVALWLNAGRTLVAPDWVRTLITDRISAQLPTLDIAFDDVSVVIPEDPSLRIAVSGVRISQKDGSPITTLDKFTTSLSLRALMRGTVKPKDVTLAGSSMVLRKLRDGTFTLSGDVISGSTKRAVNIIALLEELDTILSRPNLSRLRAVDASNITMRYEDEQAEQAWTADGGQVKLLLDGNRFTLRGNLSLLGARDYATTVDATYEGLIGGPEAQFGFTLQDMPTVELAGQSPALNWLSVIDAPVSGAMRGVVTEQATLGPLNATLSIDKGVLRPNQLAREVGFDAARVYFTYYAETETMVLDELTLDSPWVSAQAEGRARLIRGAGRLAEMEAQLRVNALDLDPANLYDAPRHFEQVGLTAKLGFETFVVDLGALDVTHGDVTLRATGTIRADEDGWRVGIQSFAPKLSPDALLSLWPARANPKLRGWIAENVEAAHLSDVSAALTLAPRVKPDLSLSFSFDEARLRVIRDFPPLRGARGHGSLYGNRFAVTATGGEAVATTGEALDITGTSFVIPDTGIREGPAYVELHASGEIGAALKVIDEPPFRFLTKARRGTDLAQGQAEVKGRIDLRLKNKLPIEEVRVDLAADLRDVRSDTLVQGHSLTAQALQLGVSTTQLSIAGDMQLDGVPLSARWSTGLGSKANGTSTVKGTVELSPRLLKALQIGLPDGMVTGAGPADLVLTLPKGGGGRFDLRSDLQGVGLSVPELNWSLPAKTRAALQVKGAMGPPARVELLTLDAPGLTLKGDVTVKPGGGLDRVHFDRVQLRDWLDATADLVGRGPGLSPAISLSGGRVDLRKMVLGKGTGGASGGGGGQAAPLRLALDEVVVTDTLSLRRFRSQLSLDGGAAGEFAGLVNGTAPVNGRIKPYNGRSAVLVQSADAGAVLTAAGLGKNVRGGALELSLVPTGASGTFDGDLRATDIRIKEAPVMASILNAISLVGLINELSGDGIYFSEVLARFRLSPDQVTLTEASAVGASMGISMDGYYFPRSKKLDLQGVLSPIYVVNAIGRLFSRRGEGLIGFNYAVTGSADAPAVQVNPLSMFTPGMFRDLFRRPPPVVQQ